MDSYLHSGNPGKMIIKIELEERANCVAEAIYRYPKLDVQILP